LSSKLTPTQYSIRPDLNPRAALKLKMGVIAEESFDILPLINTDTPERDRENSEPMEVENEPELTLNKILGVKENCLKILISSSITKYRVLSKS